MKFYRRSNENQYHFNKDVHVKETFLKLSDEVEKVTSSDVRVTDAI